MADRLTGARVAVVSGKGGVGKTTVAAALAIAAARAGKRVLLADLEDRESFAPIFGLERLAYTEQPLAPGISGLTVEADEALIEYLRMFYGIPKFSRALIRSKAVEFATQTAPGLKDILMIGKVKSAEVLRRDDRYAWDLIVVDAPPTGRLPRTLDAPRAVAELVTAGPIRRQARGVQDMVLDPARLQVILVTLPEEMPVRETIESAATLEAMGVALGPIVVNGVWPELKGLGRNPVATLRAAAGEASMDLPDDAIEALAAVAGPHAKRARNQRKAIAALSDERAGTALSLPFLFTARMGRPEVDTLAAALDGSGML